MIDTQTLRVLFASSSLLLALVGCAGMPEAPEAPAPIEYPSIDSSRSILVPDGFDFKTTVSQEVGLQIKRPGGGIIPHTRVHIVNDRNEVVFKTITNAEGRLNTSLPRMIGQGRWFAIPYAIGIPQEPIPLPLPAGARQAAALAQPLLTNSASDSSGKPTVMEPREQIPSALLADITRSLPESSKVHINTPEYLSNQYDRNVLLKETGDVFISFIHEGAGYRNTFGYFTYPDGSPPTTVAEINKIVVFPNVSFQGSGGSLQTGDTVKIGRFTKGTRIGFFVIANGWDGQQVQENRETFFSLPSLNPEPADGNFNQHVAALWDAKTERLVLGLEDINRTKSGCDHDFNDVVFTVRSNPPTAIDTSKSLSVATGSDQDNDGVDDANDAFPTDPNKAFIRYFPSEGGSVKFAFEDLFPSLGDYDFNDLVISFSAVEHLGAKLGVRSVTMNFELLAVGAGYPSGFAMLIETPPTNLESFQLKRNDVLVSNAAIEPGHTNELVVPVFSNARKEIAFAAGHQFANTPSQAPNTQGNRFQVALTFKQAVTGEAAPFNPFIFRTNERGKEVHLLGKRPSELANTALFGTGDDRSDASAGEYYKGKNKKPWALMLDSAWTQPHERTDIANAYPDYSRWIQSSGSTHRTWMSNRITTKSWNRTRE